MQDLTVTLIQADLHWEDTDANLARLDTHLATLDQASDIIILPEMFSTGFSMAAETLAEPMSGPTISWLKKRAASKDAVITGSLIVKEAGQYFNRLVWAAPDGALSYYDKKHLFRYAGEQNVYSAGEALAIWKLKGWRIRPFICYDLRFPIWCRNLNNTYDVALFVANWPAKRAFHWRQLLKARAIENQAYVIGVNRVGNDGNGHRYDGASAVIDPAGVTLFEADAESAIHCLSLPLKTLKSYRKAFPAWMDADVEMIKEEKSDCSK